MAGKKGCSISGSMATRSPRQSDLPVVLIKKSKTTELNEVLNRNKILVLLNVVEKPPSI